VPVPGCSVSCFLRTPEVDKLVRLARRHDVSVSALLRGMIRREPRSGGVEPIEK